MRDIQQCLGTPPLHSTLLTIGEGSLVGITPEGDAFVEIVQDETWLVQYRIGHNGKQVAYAHEAQGDSLLTLPDRLHMPETPRILQGLNWNHGRWRGLREEENVQQRVIPINLQAKMQLIAQHQLNISPMMLFGIDESTILSGLPLSTSHYLMCRRLRIVQALPEIHYDRQLMPYDYDSLMTYHVQVYNSQNDTVMPSDTTSLEIGVMLHRPMDCIHHGDYLYLFDAGHAEEPAQLHVWKWTSCQDMG
jgi:hypothetical protein